VKYMTIHIQQRAALEAAVKAAEPFGIQLLGVTLLTSMDEKDMEDLSYNTTMQGEALRGFKLQDPVGTVVRERVKHGVQCGLNGFVCSPKEVAALSSDYPGFYLVPGVRPLGSDIGDQKRIGTPTQAVTDGANLIVIGRPIRNAKDPAKAVQQILAEIQG